MKLPSKSILLSTSIILFTVINCWAQQLHSNKMNVLLIVADDMGMQMGALNTPGVKTPAIDSLVANGMFLKRAYATYPSCSPSRTSFLTGTYPHVNGVTTNVNETLIENGVNKAENPLNQQFAIKDGIATITSALKDAGYFTGLTGKFHVPSSEKFPFDYWGKDVNANEFFTKAKSSGKPFFLDYNFHSPHRPYQKSPHDRSKINLNELEIPPFLPDNLMMQKDWSDYLGAVESSDREVSDVIAALKKHGLDKNTLIIFTSDHGPSTNRGKYYEYDFSTHVPLIFSGPGILKGVRTNSLSSLVDVMPTILDILKIPIPKSVNGKSLKNLVQNNENIVDDYVYSDVAFPRNGETNYQARTIFDGRFWYVRRNGKPRLKGKPEDNYDQKVWKNFSYTAVLEGKEEFPLQYQLMLSSEGTLPVEELYDMHSDPWNMHDIIKLPEYKFALSKMREAMDKYLVKTNDQEMKGILVK
jgi:N-sulfoglucosamine sulfohydrolase